MDDFNGKFGQDDPTHEARAARLFSRYSRSKMDQFKAWLEKPHGKRVYELFSGFARQWWEGDVVVPEIGERVHERRGTQKEKNCDTPDLVRERRRPAA